jgi:phosphate transport system substrate-binding protein
VLLKRLAGLTCSAFLMSSLFVGINAAAASAAKLQGAGSTLIAPLEAEWGAAWGNQTGNTVNYAAVGSGTGYKDIAAGLVDFGASDAPLSVYSSPPCNSCVQIPWGLTATGVSFHINGLKRLHLTGPTLAKIYLGQITNWNNPALERLNGHKLPNLPISVFYRSDSSGDTYAFTRYLSDVSSPFSTRVGSSTTVRFPTGTGAKGNTGMASAVQGTNGAIAYVAVSYLINASLPAAAIQNRGGRYTVPNLSAIEAAARSFKNVPASNQVTIVNPSKHAKSAYPISTYTYAIIPTNASQGATLRSFLSYCLGGGQKLGPRLDFAPLPSAVLTKARRTVGSIH